METLAPLADAARAELVDHVLPYWADRAVDHAEGGFVGRIDGHDRLVEGAPKGAVLNARILWTFAAACRALGTGPLEHALGRPGRPAENAIQDRSVPINMVAACLP